MALCEFRARRSGRGYFADSAISIAFTLLIHMHKEPETGEGTVWFNIFTSSAAGFRGADETGRERRHELLEGNPRTGSRRHDEIK